MSVSSARATPRPFMRAKLPVATVSVVVVAAAIGGLLLGGFFGGGDAPAVRPATARPADAHDGLRLQVPSGWVRGDAATVPGFSRPLGLSNAGEQLRASVERLPATSATLLPVAFEMTLKTAPERPDVVRLASGQQAWRYRFPQDDGSLTVLYAAPTTSGVATVACMSTIDAGVPHGCEALASAVTVPGSRPLVPGTSAAFYSRLPAAVSDLDAARTKGMRELSAATRSTGQVAAANGLARAHKAAGAALAPLTSERDGVPTSTVGALTATVTAYATLASAARARSPRPYADAGRAVTGADANLRRTLTKVAAAATAASLTATQAASTPVRKPAARTTPDVAKRPAEAKPTTPAEAKPTSTTKADATSPTKAEATTPAKADATTPTKAKPTSPTKADTTTPAKATPTSPTKAEAKTPAKAKLAASTSQAVDLTLPLLALLGVFAMILAIRQTVRVVR